MKEITSQKQLTEELEKKESPHVIIDVYGTDCGPCQELSPKLEKWSEENKQTIKVLKLNIYANDETKTLCETWQIEEIPTLLFFSHGILRPLLTMTGYQGHVTMSKLNKHAMALQRMR